MERCGGRGGRCERLLELGYPAAPSCSDADGGAGCPVIAGAYSRGAGACSDSGPGTDGKGISVP